MRRLLEIQKLRILQAASEYGRQRAELHDAQVRHESERIRLEGLENKLLQTISEVADGNACHAAISVACIGRLRSESEQGKYTLAGCAAELELAARREQNSRNILSRRRAMLRATERIIERRLDSERLSEETRTEDSLIECGRTTTALTHRRF